MVIISGTLPHHTVYQTALGWTCKGDGSYGHGQTPTEAVNDWIYMIRYNSDGRNW